MSLQQFCLRWNNHQPNFVSVFTSLLNNESLVDVTLAAEGKHLQAHKVVLSACSSYFQTLFSVNPCQHPIVILKDVKYDDLKTMVDFMYYGEVNVSQEQLPAILKTADTLKIKGLAEMPEHHFRLSKSMSGSSTERTDLPATGESVWSSDAVCRSTSPASPSSRRKRLRKTSTGSGSGSTEVTSEEVTNEITVLTSHTVKPEPYHTLSEDGGHSDASLNRNTSLEASTDSEPPRQISQESVEDEQQSLHMTNESSIHVGENMVTNVDSKPLTHHQSLPSQAYSPSHKPGKRGRPLIRQPRVKKDMDTSHTSPESEPSSPQLTSSNLLSVPPVKIERQHSEPPMSTSPPPSSSHNLLTVPSTILVKQMSHPLLPSQQPSSPKGTATLFTQRQMSQPTAQPMQVHLVAAAAPVGGKETSSCVTTPGLMVEQLPVFHVFPDNSSESSKGILRSTLRVRSEEIPSHSASQVPSPKEGSEPRSVHCPVLRPGPALGCNFCWNTIDGHGRILRRKTKYHCPECQTNLCIVPCFQEYHERQAITETRESSGAASPTVVKILPKTSSI